jgi:hypothetical protein
MKLNIYFFIVFLTASLCNGMEDLDRKCFIKNIKNIRFPRLGEFFEKDDREYAFIAGYGVSIVNLETNNQIFENCDKKIIHCAFDFNKKRLILGEFDEKNWRYFIKIYNTEKEHYDA